jgi:hypothetical protein
LLTQEQKENHFPVAYDLLKYVATCQNFLKITKLVMKYRFKLITLKVNGSYQGGNPFLIMILKSTPNMQQI